MTIPYYVYGEKDTHYCVQTGKELGAVLPTESKHKLTSSAPTYNCTLSLHLLERVKQLLRVGNPGSTFS